MDFFDFTLAFTIFGMVPSLNPGLTHQCNKSNWLGNFMIAVGEITRDF